MRGYMRHDPSRFGARPVASAVRLLVATWGIVCLLVATAYAQPAAPTNLGVGGSAVMDVTIANSNSATGTDVTAAGKLTFAVIGPSSSGYVLVGVVAWDATASETLPAGVTYGGNALTALGNRLDGNGNRTSWWGATTALTGSQSVVVTPSGTISELGAVGITFNDVDQTTSTANYVSAEDSGAGEPITVNGTAASGDLVIDVAYANKTPADWTADQTTIAEAAITGDAVVLSSSGSGVGTVTMSWQGPAGVVWNTSAITVKQAAAGGAALDEPHYVAAQPRTPEPLVSVW